MDITEKSKIPLEILVSTMNRVTLDFLFKMFQNNNLNKYQILVINQTTENNLLHSDYDNIRVINSFQKGLSRSRNLAIENAVGDICLLADDDVIYLKDFESHIINIHKKLSDADVITFKTLTPTKEPYSNYPNNIKPLGKFYKKVLSIEISFVRKSFSTHSIQFDEMFGLGSDFEDGENRILFKEIQSKGLKAYFVPEFIVIHEQFNSSSEVTSDRFIFARGALNYKLYGIYAYVYITKLIFSIFRKRLINFKDISSKFNMGLKGINAYKKSVNG